MRRTWGCSWRASASGRHERFSCALVQPSSLRGEPFSPPRHKGVTKTQMSAPHKPLPVWADVALIPLINVAAAFIISGLVVLAIGENPIEAVKILIGGAIGDLEGL